jgi:hypothetical protein
MGGAGGPVVGRDDGKELSELMHPLCLAPRREHVMGEVECLVFTPVKKKKKNLRVTPRTIDGVSMVSGVRIDELD